MSLLEEITNRLLPSKKESAEQKLERVWQGIQDHPKKGEVSDNIFLLSPSGDTRVKGMTVSKDDVQRFLNKFPDPETYWQHAQTWADVFSHATKEGIPVRRSMLNSFRTLGEITYQQDWKKKIENEKKKRMKDALPKSKEYLQNGIISGKIPDGFQDAGRQAILSKENKTVILKSHRETILVDRQEDFHLQELIENAKKIAESSGTEQQKVFAIIQLVLQRIGNFQSLKKLQSHLEKHAFGKLVHLGEFNKAEGFPGVCRHIALTIQTVLGDLGYDVTMRRGILSNLQITDAHSWNEITLDGKKFVLDASLGRFNTKSFEHFVNSGGFPEPGKGVAPDFYLQGYSQYKDVNGKLLYVAADSLQSEE